MCTSLRHHHQVLTGEFCDMWEKLQKVQSDKEAELFALKSKYAAVRKDYKYYREQYQTIVAKYEQINDPIWDEFDNRFNQDVRG